MKKMFAAKVRQLAALLVLAAMMFTLAACSEPDTPDDSLPDRSAPVGTAPEPEAEQPEGEFIFTLYGDFSCGMSYAEAEENGLIVTQEVALEYEPTVEEMAFLLSQWTGLDFFLTGADVEDGNVYVDWDEDSTLIAGLDDRELYEEFFFYDAVSLNWFMLDSLARTIQYGLPDAGQYTIYYSWGGGEALAFPEMQGLEYLAQFDPYYGSAYLVGNAQYDGLDGKGDLVWDGENVYFDEVNSIALYYPNIFEGEGYITEDDEVAFPLFDDGRTTLRYWVVENTYVHTEDERTDFIERLLATEITEMPNDVLVGYLTTMNQMTGEWTDHAFYIALEPTRIVMVYIDCQYTEEAQIWYNHLQYDSVYYEDITG